MLQGFVGSVWDLLTPSKKELMVYAIVQIKFIDLSPNKQEYHHPKKKNPYPTRSSPLPQTLMAAL